MSPEEIQGIKAQVLNEMDAILDQALASTMGEEPAQELPPEATGEMSELDEQEYLRRGG